jgi:hypothetical protein
MAEYVFLISVPGLRDQDLAAMPNLRALTEKGDKSALVPSFPAVTCPVQVNMTTGAPPRYHGVIANGFYWRDKHEVEMWTAWNDVIQKPQIWDLLEQHDSSLKSAVWFPLLSKGCGAEYVCTPAPIHNPDGSESLWCYTKPTELYGELRDKLGHFPLQNFWGPLSSIKSTDWIVDSAVEGAKRFKPNFFYIYLPHLDYAAQKFGPDSPEAAKAVVELDEAFGRLARGFDEAYGDATKLWLVASEYAIVPVNHVLYPNRLLREHGFLEVKADLQGKPGEMNDFEKSPAWALADHQFSHIFVRDRDADTLSRVVSLFEGQTGVDEVLYGDGRAKYDLDHEHAGDVVVISTANSWQAYYYWLDDSHAPSFARTVDIHRKPGYDPAEMTIDMATRSIPLDASIVRGSHGAPAKAPSQRGVLLSSQAGALVGQVAADIDIADLVLRQFGI